MKITKTDVSAQAAESLFDVNSMQSDAPTDVFYSMILQMMTEMKAQPDQVDQKLNSDVKFDATQSEQKAFTMNDVLNQFNFVENKVENNVENEAKTTLDSMAVLPADQLLSNKSNLTPITTSDLPLPNEAMENKTLTQASSLLNDPIIFSQKIDIAQQSVMMNKSSSETPENPLLLNTTNKDAITVEITKNPLFANKVTTSAASNNTLPKVDLNKINIEKNKPKLTTLLSANTNQYIADPVIIRSIKSAEITADVTNSDSALQAPTMNTTFNHPMDQAMPQPLVPQLDKHMETFTQLSHLINGLTLQASNLEQPTVSSNVTTDYLTQARTEQTSAYEPKIEMLAPSIEAFMKDTYEAKIKIYPPDLGSVIAKLKMGKDGTELSIMTENSRVKEIVEANLSQLQQSFRDADINLTQVNVQADLSNTKDQSEQNPRHSSQNMAKENANKEEQQFLSSNRVTKKSDQLVDTYA